MANVDTPVSWGELRALGVFVTYLTACSSLTILIGNDLVLYVRRGTSRPRNGKLLVFTSLAVFSLLVTWFYMIQFFQLSYRTWAYDHNRPAEGGKAQLGFVNFSTILQLGSWLQDVQLFRDAWEVTTETYGRLFWSLPIFPITAAWSIMLANNGRVRNLWAYMLLGQIVAISFAANLFFLASVLTEGHCEAANAGTILPRGRTGRFLQSIPIVLTIGSVVALPYVSNTAYFLPTLGVPHLALFLPLLPCLRFRETDTTAQHATQEGFRLGLYWVVFGLGACAQLYTTFQVAQSGVESHAHRHSRPFNMPDGNSSVTSSTDTLSQILQALYDHPAVTSVGCDFILCTASFSAWAAWSQLSATPKHGQSKARKDE